MKRIAVLLAGCGHKDGTEITEAVSALIALSEAGASYQIFAPELVNEGRNIRVESARIARQEVPDVRELNPKDFDGLVIPGGFGAARHLCNWATAGAQCEVHPEVRRVIEGFHSQEKPIAAICIAPALVARVLGNKKITVTIGKNDIVTSAEISKTGAIHEDCNVDDFVSDRDHKIITTPAYMFGDAKPFQVYTGVRKAIREFVEMA